MSEFLKIIKLATITLGMAIVSYFLSSNTNVNNWVFFRATDPYYVESIVHQEPPNSFDWVILGSSLTGLGVNTQKMEKTHNVKSVNLSHVFFEPYLDYQIMSRFLKRQSSKNFAVIITTSGDTNFHSWIPFVVDNLTFAELFSNLDWPYNYTERKDIVNGAVLSAINMGTVAFTYPLVTALTDRCQKSVDCLERNKTNGFWEHTAVHSFVNLENKYSVKPASPGAGAPHYYKQHQKLYFEKMAALAKAHNSKIFFLDMPMRNGNYVKNEDLEFFNKLGKVISFADVEFQAEDWFDDAHLSLKGSEKLTEALVKKIEFTEQLNK